MRILVADDNKIDANEVANRIEELRMKNIKHSITVCVDEKQLRYDIKINTYDIAFLDIEIGKTNGISIAEKLLKKNPKCIIIFISSYPGYITDALELDIFQFICKEKFKEKFDRVYYRAVKEYQKRYAICEFNTTKGKRTFIPYDIISVETFYNNLRIKTIKGSHYSNIKNIKFIRESLEPFDFILIHQSQFINLNHVQKVTRHTVVMKSGQEYPLIDSRRKQVTQSFAEYLIRVKFNDK